MSEEVADKLDFKELYDKLLRTELVLAKIPEGILEELKEKSDFGYEKYGDAAFQASYDSLIAANEVQHLYEELFDAINYIGTRRVKERLGTDTATKAYKQKEERLLKEIARFFKN